MKFLGIFTSHSIEEIFTNNGVKNLFQYTTKDNIPIRIGYCFMNNECTLRYLAIQMENTPTFEMFELFEMEIGPLSFDEIKPIAKSIADEVIAYNKAVIQYYVKKEI